MKKILLPILFFSLSVLADVEVYDWILPIRIHNNDGTSSTAWVECQPMSFYRRNPEFTDVKRPIPGKKVLFLNKLGFGDSIIISEQLYLMPDSFQCLIDKKIAMESVDLIEDISSDSLRPIGIWTSRRLSAQAGKVVLEKEPVFTDLIITEQDAAYNAEHVYCYDPSFTMEQVRALYAEGGRDNPTLSKALDENRIIMIFEATP